MNTIRSSIAALALLAAASCIAAQGPSPDWQPSTAAAPPTATAPVSGLNAIEGTKAHHAALQDRNTKLLSRSELCTKRVREGVIKSTASAQYACRLGTDPK